MLFSMDGLRSAFDIIGSVPRNYHIAVDPDITPVQHGHRKVSIELQEDTVAQLFKMVNMSTVIPKPPSTTWISFLTYPRTGNHSIYVCLGLKDLNKAIIHEHHKTPVLENVTHRLIGLKVYSKLGNHNGF